MIVDSTEIQRIKKNHKSKTHKSQQIYSSLHQRDPSSRLGGIRDDTAMVVVFWEEAAIRKQFLIIRLLRFKESKKSQIQTHKSQIKNYK